MIVISQFSSDPQPLQENIDDINHGVVKLSAMVGKGNKKKFLLLHMGCSIEMKSSWLVVY